MIRACIVQSIVAHYRRGVFNRVADEADIDLTAIAQVTVPKDGRKPIAQADAYRIIPGKQRSFGPFISRPSVMDAVRGNYDVVILPWHPRTLELPKALRHARKRGLPVALWGHGYSKHETWLKTWNRNRIARLAAGLLLYDPVNAERMIEAGFDRERVFVTNNAIDQTEIEVAIKSWKHDPSRLADFQREHGLIKSKTAVVISRLQPEKDFTLLIDALSQVVAKEPDARLIIIGGGSCESELRAKVSSLGLEHAVIFAGELYDQEKIAPWCLSACCFPYPPNIGLGLQHAMAYGVPVITHDNAGVHGPEIHALRDGENGCIFRAGDAGDLAGAILRMMRDPESQARMSKAAYNTVRGPDGWSVEHMADTFVKCIREMAKLNTRGKID